MNDKHTNDKLNEALGMLNDKYITEAENFTKKQRGHILHAKKWYFAAAACITLIVLSLGIYGYAADVKEYNEALSFFRQYELSTDGLSRGDIKKVYRDITAGSFSYDKTTDVILSNITVDGYELYQDELSSDEIERIWNYIKNIKNHNAPGIPYKSDPIYSRRYVDGSSGNELASTTFFEKYEGTQSPLPIWSIEFKNVDITEYVVSDGYIFMYGVKYIGSSDTSSWIALMTEEGNILWEKTIQYAYTNNPYKSVTLLCGESLTLLCPFYSNGTTRLSIREYDFNGNLCSECWTDLSANDERCGVLSAVRLGDGSIFIILRVGDADKIVKVNAKGEQTDAFTYKSDDSLYSIQDIIEYEGNVYISAYAIPRRDNISQLGGHDEVRFLLEEGLYRPSPDERDNEMTPYIRDNYTAVLFVCDPDSGEPGEFYSAPGSIGSSLSIGDNGMLIWDVANITSAYFSPATSAFSVYGICNIYRYTFDGNGIFSQVKTEEVTTFYR